MANHVVTLDLACWGLRGLIWYFCWYARCAHEVVRGRACHRRCSDSFLVRRFEWEVEARVGLLERVALFPQRIPRLWRTFAVRTSPRLALHDSSRC